MINQKRGKRQDRQFFLNNLWRWKCGISEQSDEYDICSYKKAIKTEWSDDFEQLMRNRLICGLYRYGKIEKNVDKKYNRIRIVFERLRLYKETGNLEYLVDIANLAMVEFLIGKHPNKHFKAIDGGNHVKEEV